MRRGLFGGRAMVAAVVAAVLASTTPAFAQSYPDRSVRIIIAFAAGGTIDTLGRIVAQKLSEFLGPIGVRGEPPRRQWQYRRRSGGAGAARRLYASSRRAGAGGERDACR
jgi:hypothetical protein